MMQCQRSVYHGNYDYEPSDPIEQAALEERDRGEIISALCSHLIPIMGRLRSKIEI